MPLNSTQFAEFGYSGHDLGRRVAEIIRKEKEIHASNGWTYILELSKSPALHAALSAYYKCFQKENFSPKFTPYHFFETETDHPFGYLIVIVPATEDFSLGIKLSYQVSQPTNTISITISTFSQEKSASINKPIHIGDFTNLDDLIHWLDMAVEKKMPFA